MSVKLLLKMVDEANIENEIKVLVESLDNNLAKKYLYTILCGLKS